MHLVAQRNRGRVVSMFMIFSMLVIIYSLLFSAYLLSASPKWQIFFFQLMVFITIFIPMAILFFLLEYLGYDNCSSWKNSGLLMAIPVIAGVLELTDPLHGYFWEKMEIINSGGFSYIREVPGSVPILLIIYLYLIMGFSLALLSWGVFNTPKHHRKELSLIVIALGIPLFSDLLRTFHLTPWPHLYLTPYAVLISVLALGIAIIRYDFLNAIPAAYSRLFTDVTDAILVFDHKYNLMDLNLAASKLFSLDHKIQMTTTLNVFPEAVQDAVKAQDIEIALTVDEELKYFDINRSELSGKDGLLRSVVLTFHDISMRKQLELWHQDLIREKQSLLAEKEVLLREINHRVKNNFNLAGSLLFLEAQKFKDKKVRNAFEVSRDRLRTMSLLNERLYRSEKFDNLDLGSYLCSIAEDLMSFQVIQNVKVELECDTVAVGVGPREAIPCGLIVNELVTNSLKHAFPGKSEGAPVIALKLSQGKDGLIKLQVADNGKGYPDSYNYEESDSLGLKLVQMLGHDQLGGTVRFGNRQGAFFNLSFFTEVEAD